MGLRYGYVVGWEWDRWIGRQILEVISTEFRDRSVDYYVSAALYLLYVS